MTHTQSQHAACHDWYLGSYLSDGVWHIVAQDDMVQGNELVFTNYNRMLIWAGY